MREHLFVHLEHPLDKLNLLLAMIHKLYALVGGQCCDDNPDALTHHEIMLPGQLLCKFLQDKLQECLEMFRAQARGHAIHPSYDAHHLHSQQCTFRRSTFLSLQDAGA